MNDNERLQAILNLSLLCVGRKTLPATRERAEGLLLEISCDRAEFIKGFDEHKWKRLAKDTVGPLWRNL